MKINNRTISLFLAVIMIVSLAVTSTAAAPKIEQDTGSISIEIKDGDYTIPGIILSIYKVADVVKNGEYDYSFVLTNDFKDSGASLANVGKDIGSYDLAEEIAEYITENEMQPDEIKETGRDGKVSFDDLDLGLYLIMQYRVSQGYYVINPFLVSVPMLEKDAYGNDKYNYDIDASPKVEAEDQPDQPSFPGGPVETEPKETEPKETEPETKPKETEPKETEPETEPKETKPKETEPKETEPDEIETVETEPVETDTPESEPTETEPEETETEPETETEENITDETEPESNDSQLPQTGQLNWPIPVLVIGGLVMLFIGWLLIFREKDKNED